MKELQGKCILIADDEIGIVTALENIFTYLGATVYTAENGGEAWERFNSESKLDVVITDATMPGKDCDGLTFVRRIRETSPEMLILMITGHSEEVLDQALAAGVDHVIAKPFRMEEVIELLVSSV
jgi:CheY-like chemotaxis protein